MTEDDHLIGFCEIMFVVIISITILIIIIEAKHDRDRIEELGQKMERLETTSKPLEVKIIKEKE